MSILRPGFFTRPVFTRPFLAASLLVAGLLAAAPPAVAQAPSPPDPGLTNPTPPEPPKELPKPQRGDRTKNLDQLFAALKVAPDDTSAKNVENRIWAVWLTSQSDTANLLMTRMRTAMEAKNSALALRLLNSIIEIRPDYVEAWNRRATLHYMNKDFGPALADLRQVLAREPRHFGALSGLGMIMQQLDDDKAALEAYRRAVAVHPRLQKIPDLIKKLSETVDGRDI